MCVEKESEINIQSIEKGWFTLTIPYIVMDCTKQQIEFVFVYSNK